MTERTEPTLLEGIAGIWHYHLPGDNGAALCGERRVMGTSAPVSTWRQWYPDHLPVSYCVECERRRGDG